MTNSALAAVPPTAPYEVRLGLFNGPLDLLLRLIERRELDITLISLAAVTDQYLRHVESLVEPDPDQLADFIVVAAKLLAIKAMALICPPAAPDAEDEAEGEALVRALREYQVFRQAAAQLRVREELGQRCYARETSLRPIRLAAPNGLCLDDLIGALHRRVVRAEVPAAPSEPEAVQFTVKEQIAMIEAALAGAPRVAFRDLMPLAAPLVQVIVTFLALLELLKAQRIQVTQSAVFGEIVLAPTARAAPQGGPE